MKNIYILGATGTIGLQTIDVILKHEDLFKVVGLSLGNSNKDKHQNIIDTLKPEIVSLRDQSLLETYQKRYPNIKFTVGDIGLLQLVRYPKKGIVVNGLSGSAGLKPTIEAIQLGKDIALANKETLVMAGDLINELVKKHPVKLIPIDSEHNAILNAMIGENKSSIKSITITASGGSFRNKTRDQLKDVTIKDALNHPNWTMGSKITIDSATMMNKGLEVIEAHHLFNLDYKDIHTVLHKESIVHGFVTYKDESVKAVLANPDMRMPILYALTYPDHYTSGIEPLDLTNMNLSFKPMDFKRFILLKIAYEVGIKGGLYPVVMNAANEIAVQLFLEGKISFLEIETIVIEALNSFNSNITYPNLDEILETDKFTKRKVLDKYGFYN
ncbi:MAG: 1-deoxy-D-xylulose-5-phosphate reductoisomerase [Acholeplasmataceae bacterium]|nr:1-deoxy-D-xylulose-5-phosphate reductoisomerase [Acholeplasmataceae bacterium]